ncbi:hypothetical protein H4J57_19505 [Colwellia sp. BRX8-7]|uniref:hypothetical protein n=1 Tax=Colwellia sp. BRX8-7 TaxID=2759833 RepID=UPI0015F65678|nr:hypothetical protein [Colwellia sp. BRX8-7]MBA6339374.1 hypothetical protein [Colwellia sp. BRX8-7]
MAFDMYSGIKEESIAHYEECIFSYVNQSDSFPELKSICENFYRDPKISPAESNKIVHELIQIKAMLQNNTEQNIVDRLLQFFSYSFINSENVRCVSD